LRISIILLLLVASTAAAADRTVTLEVLETPGLIPTTARISVTGSDDLPGRPLPDSLCLFHSSLGGFFYADSAAVLVLPDGETRIVATKGPEYDPLDLTVTIDSDTSFQLVLDRWVSMPDSGWLSGEGHGDLTHEPATYHPGSAEARWVAGAEGLGVAQFLDNGFLFTGEVAAVSDESVVIFASEEYRSPIFGHLALYGIDTLIVPMNGHAGWPLNTVISGEVSGHDHALTSYAHPLSTTDFFDLSGWPGTGLGRGIGIDVALGGVDAMDVLSWSNLGTEGGVALDLWYDLWNGGFTVTGSAGSDVSIGRLTDPPIGSYRVYAWLPNGDPDPAERYDDWVDAIRRGRTFVTTGPLLTSFDLDGSLPGDTIDRPDGSPVDLPFTARIESTHRLGTIEVLLNGEAIRTYDPYLVFAFAVTCTVPVRETSWIAVRHDGTDPASWLATDRALLHSTPVLVRIGDDGRTSTEVANRFLARFDSLEILLDTASSYPSASESLAVAEGIDSARAVWSARANDGPGSFHLLYPGNGFRLTDRTPTLVWEEAIDPDSAERGAGVTYRLVIATDGDFTAVLYDTSGIDTTVWTPPSDLSTEECFH